MRITRLATVLGALWLSACGGGSGSGGNAQVAAPPPADPPPVAEQTCLADVPAIADRSLVDRPDDVSGPQLHAVFAIPADGTDTRIDINGQLQTEMEVAQRWLQEQTGRCMRMDTFQGALDVTFVQFSRTNQQMRDDPDFVDQTVELEFEARGLDNPEKVYVVYYGGSADNGSCGGAAAIGGPAMQFLVQQNTQDGPLTGCPFFSFVSGPTGRFRASWSGVAVHETFHSLGVVPFCAPDHDDAHPLHLETISSDLMAFDGTGFSTYTLDARRTEYYDHTNPGCLDLADSAVWDDAGAGADPLPGRIAYSQPRAIACADEPTTQSAGGDVDVTVRVANVTGQPVLFYQLDETGVRQNPLRVEPYSDWFTDASEDDVFVVTDADSGECIGLYEMVAGTNRVLVTE